jgi:hypothetical protein
MPRDTSLQEPIMNEPSITVLTLTAAAICSACIVLTLPVIAGAALRGDLRRMLRTLGVATMFAVLALAAFAVVGADAVGYLGRT